uniref:Uncharacterized protein n=1 Tax=Fagus sylvatica TaxID=28930 RepID=A0A2N9ILA2_FAGSY
MSHSLHSSPQHPQSTIQRISGPSRQEVSSGSSYRPSRGIPAATSLILSLRQVDLHQHLDSWRSRQNERASREVTPQRARRSLNFSSSAESRSDDSEKIIAELCWEISDLKKEARGRLFPSNLRRSRAQVVQSARAGNGWILEPNGLGFSQAAKRPSRSRPETPMLLPPGRGLVSNRSGNLGAAPIGVIHVILKPLCTSILSVSFRSDLQKTAHLRQSFGLSDSAHLAPKSCSEVPKSSNQQVISFSNGDLRDVQLPHSDPLVITLEIGNYDVKKVLIDQGSFAEVMYQELYEKLGWESLISPISHPQCFPPRMELWKVEVSHQGWNYGKLRFPTKDGIMEVNGDRGKRRPSSSKAMCPGGNQPKGYKGNQFYQGPMTFTATRNCKRRKHHRRRSQEVVDKLETRFESVGAELMLEFIELDLVKLQCFTT